MTKRKPIKLPRKKKTLLQLCAEGRRIVRAGKQNIAHGMNAVTLK